MDLMILAFNADDVDITRTFARDRQSLETALTHRVFPVGGHFHLLTFGRPIFVLEIGPD
jgi:hypothetical protein